MYEPTQSVEDNLVNESVEFLENWCFVFSLRKGRERIAPKLLSFYELWKLNKIAAAKFMVDAQFCTNQNPISSDLLNFDKYVQSFPYSSLAKVALLRAIEAIDWQKIIDALEPIVLKEVESIIVEVQSC